MKIISFDIGIKNMAYCIFDLSSSIGSFAITEWKVANLIQEEKADSFFCTCNSTKKPKKGQPSKPCGRKAKFQTPILETNPESQYLCDKHAKTQTDFRIPESKFSEKVLKTTKLDTLIQLWQQVIPETIERPKKRADIITFMTDYLKPLTLCPIVSKKETSANDIDLVTIGKSIRSHFDLVIRENPDIGIVLIENQISPIANRMKTIQGLLAQYFIMRYDMIDIRMISSSNKLKQFVKKEESCDKSNEEKTDGQKYKEHKKDAVLYCKQLFDTYKIDSQWLAALDTKKKDDLADCFLQGIWFLQKQKYIE